MPTTPPTHYHILNLPFPSSSSSQNHPTPSKQDLKLAYHRALLRYHPDKSSASSTRTKPTTTTQTQQKNGDTQIYTIDEITTAYKILSNPGSRAEYDRELRLSRPTQDAENGKNENGKGDDIFHTGLETVDLEDLGYSDGDGTEEEEGYWYRSCRCGDEKGFFVTEGDLEREVEAGEILVGCKGCSLWLRVLFAVVDGEEEDGVS